MAAKTERNRLLAKVHIAKKDLGLDDDVYRELLDNMFGRRSAADLSTNDLFRLLRHFRSCGWRQKPSRSGWMDLPAGISMEAQKRYVAALWGALGYKMSGLDYRCKKQFGVDRFMWLANREHLMTLAKDLVNRCKRRGIEHRAEFYRQE